MSDRRLRELRRAWVQSRSMEDQRAYLGEHERLNGFFVPMVVEVQLYMNGRLLMRSRVPVDPTSGGVVFEFTVNRIPASDLVFEWGGVVTSQDPGTQG